MKTTLVRGAGGFVGGHLVKRLKKKAIGYSALKPFGRNWVI